MNFHTKGVLTSARSEKKTQKWYNAPRGGITQACSLELEISVALSLRYFGIWTTSKSVLNDRGIVCHICEFSLPTFEMVFSFCLLVSCPKVLIFNYLLEMETECKILMHENPQLFSNLRVLSQGLN